MITLHIDEQQLAWIAQAFSEAGVEVLREMDPEANLEQQLFELGGFDGIPCYDGRYYAFGDAE